MSRIILLLLLFFAKITLSAGQGTPVAEGSNQYFLLDRFDILSSGRTPFHTSLKPFLQSDAVSFAFEILKDSSLSEKNREDLFFLFDDNNEWIAAGETPLPLTAKAEKGKLALDSENHSFYKKTEKPLFGIFYKTPANFFELNKKDFYLRVNPVLNFFFAKDKNGTEPVFLNRRGLDIRAGVDDRIFIYTNIHENQARFADYVNERIARDKAVPGAGLFKNYESDIFNISKGYDFLNAQAVIGFNVTRHVGVQFGHGRNFIGNGYRSLLLSDFANNYFYLKLNWRVWRFQLQNIFAELAAEPKPRSEDRLLTKKYMASHHLSYDITPNLNFGFFETVVFSRNNHFELQYLNPVIIYRTVEQMVGSPDNVLIGLDAKWNFLRRFQAYGQLILDEFLFKELFLENRGWWANKYGVQAGLKYVNAFGLNNLDLQAEWNSMRPYTYSHKDSSANYTHYGQALAHPLGANFREGIFLLRYRLFKKWSVDFRYIAARTGEDADSTNWGGNILLPNITREQTYGNETGQGVGAKINLAAVNVSYRLFHNFFIDAQFFMRKKDSDDDARDLTTQYFGIGLRLNSAPLKMDF